MRTIKISASFGGKIPTGSYQNMSPSFYVEETIELDDTLQDVNAYIAKRQQALQAICYANFEAEAIKAKILKIQGDRKDFRWYKLPSGEDVPSVTSILGYDSDYLIDENDMKQYAAQGTINHARVDYYIKNEGVWLEPKDIPGIGAELFILKSGSLTLPPDACNFPAFLKKHPLTNLTAGEKVVNEEDRYAGTFDLTGEAEGVLVMADLKRTPDKIKNFMQISAYIKAKKDKNIKRMMIIPLNSKTEQGYSKPIISDDIDRYYELFLAKRLEFKKIYGI